MSDEVSLTERAEDACGQEGGGDVCGGLLDVRPEHVHDPGERKHTLRSDTELEGRNTRSGQRHSAGERKHTLRSDTELGGVCVCFYI